MHREVITASTYTCIYSFFSVVVVVVVVFYPFLEPDIILVETNESDCK